MRARRVTGLAGLGFLAAVTLMTAAPASAQSFGIGPRFSFVRGDIPSGTPSTRFLGGTLRLASSRKVSFEVSFEQRSETSEDLTTRFRERPLQFSMLVFPARGVFSPYLLGGYGLYQQITDQLDNVGAVVDSVSTRTTGWHAGIGAEILRRTARGPLWGLPPALRQVRGAGGGRAGVQRAVHRQRPRVPQGLDVDRRRGVLLLTGGGLSAICPDIWSPRARPGILRVCCKRPACSCCG